MTKKHSVDTAIAIATGFALPSTTSSRVAVRSEPPPTLATASASLPIRWAASEQAEGQGLLPHGEAGGAPIVGVHDLGQPGGAHHRRRAAADPLAAHPRASFATASSNPLTKPFSRLA